MDQANASEKERPLRRDAERNRQLILATARTVFAQRGLDATLDEVARVAGVGVGTIYRRFPNREALIDALFEDGVSTIAQIAESALGEPRAWDGLRRFMAELIEIQTRDRGLRDVMLARREPAETNDIMRDRVKPPLDALVRRAHQEGDLREDLTATDIGVLEIALLGAAEFTSAVAPEAWRRFLTIILDGMRADPRAQRELPAPPLDEDQLDRCMTGWKYGSRETPAHRGKPG